MTVLLLLETFKLLEIIQAQNNPPVKPMAYRRTPSKPFCLSKALMSLLEAEWRPVAAAAAADRDPIYILMRHWGLLNELMMASLFSRIGVCEYLIK